MKLERAIVEVLFNDINPQHVIGHLAINKRNNMLIDFDTFYRSGIERFKKYSSDEIEKIYNGLKIHTGKSNIDFNNPASFFKYLGEFISTLLVYNEYEPKIKYDKLMRWNKVSHLLGQDLLTMSFLAYHDVRYNDYTEFFAYKAIISTDNRQLKNILNEGIAENHFHLKGSTRIFCLNWLSLMNHPGNRFREFKNFSIQLKPYYRYNNKKEHTLYDLIKIAVLLRIYFFEKTNKYSLKMEGKESSDNTIISLNKIDRIIKQNSIELSRFSTEISFLKTQLGFDTRNDLDYALLGNIQSVNKVSENPLVGERRLIYLAIRMILTGEMNVRESTYFYLYILIKNNFRRELIQVNDLYGFSNFSDYERRKEIFIENYPKYKNMLIKMAVKDTFESQNIISLEARVTPRNTASQDLKYIKEIDKLCYEYTDKLFYVFHFIKKKEDINDNIYFCRNYKVREEIKNQGRALARCLETSHYLRERVKGIDACNNEYFCRPEVFGQVFRFLSKLHVKSTGTKKQSAIEIYKTYHVGEDYLDISDGLRAIDEAILFCNLVSGSRLGHATVLGIDVDKYYQNKSRIIMTKQDFIDNMIWLFNKAIELGIDIYQYPLYKKMENDCLSLIEYIYGNVNGKIDMSTYYNSWKLRGDNPDRYLPDGSIKDESKLRKIDYFDFNDWAGNESRTLQANKLYYAYHYALEVKQKGQETIDFKVTPNYIKVVKEVQKRMQFEIARKGIFIECNPTSNYLIANLKKYELHPIITFYNDELTKSDDSNCAQINVSINTDDQGVFDTSLENEYALMAYALENFQKDSNYLYTPNQVYKWIDSVRKMGIQQKFK